MRWLCLIPLLAMGCDADPLEDVDAATAGDAGVEPADGGGGSDAGTPSTDAGRTPADAGPDAGSIAPEDCGTAVDEDRDGYAGCDDPECWDEPLCAEAELAEVGLTGWAECGEPLSFDATETAARCEGPMPFPSSRELDCGRVPTEVIVHFFCEPADGPGRALRYRATMDTTSESMMLGPMTTRHTSFTAELGYLGRLYLANGSSGSSGDDPAPTRDAYVPYGYRASAWVTGTSEGGTALLFLGASAQTSTFTIRGDGSVDSTSEDPRFFLTAGFEATLP